MKLRYISKPLKDLVEDLAKQHSKPIKLYVMGTYSDFLATLPKDWYSHLSPELTEEFTDSIELVFATSVPDLVARLFATDTLSASTNIVWGLISYLRMSALYYSSNTYNVHKLSNVFYMVTESASGAEDTFIFGDSLEVVGCDKLSLDLLPRANPLVASTATSPNLEKRSNSEESELGITGIPVKGSTEDPLSVEDILLKWFKVE